MALNRSRNCPLCGASATRITFPYATRFNGVRFNYLKCDGCSSVFVDPVPDSQTFARMYAKADYHDRYYEGKEGGAYTESVHLLKQYLPAGALVLDYGCGIGAFLKALGAEGFIPFGVEFDKDAAHFAGQNAGCEALSVDDFLEQPDKPRFDAIHLGDVLEHLPDPAGTLKELLGFLKPGCVVFVEGPLEINPSPVYWAARVFGAIKRIVRPKFTASHAPTHLFRTGAKQQLAFFSRAEPRLNLKYWRVYETGWPYASGGVVKRAIAGLAMRLGGRQLFEATFGNRFRGIFTNPKPSDGFNKPAYPKKTTAPTKLGEFLGCGVPCLGNSGVGDMASILEKEQVGVVLRRFDKPAMHEAINRLLQLTPDIHTRCREVALRYFSLDEGVKTYKKIHRELKGYQDE